MLSRSAEPGHAPWVTDESGNEKVAIATDPAVEKPFRRRTCLREVPVPAYGGRVARGQDVYSGIRLPVAGQGCDVVGHTRSRLIGDVLDQ